MQFSLCVWSVIATLGLGSLRFRKSFRWLVIWLGAAYACSYGSAELSDFECWVQGYIHRHNGVSVIRNQLDAVGSGAHKVHI